MLVRRGFSPSSAEPDLPFWRKLIVAVGRVSESDDDELAFAYYCAAVPKERGADSRSCAA